MAEVLLLIVVLLMLEYPVWTEIKREREREKKKKRDKRESCAVYTYKQYIKASPVL